MNKSFIKSIPPMKWEEIKKIKEEIRRIKPEDIAPLTSEERKQMADNKDVYEYLSFDVQIKLLGIKPENVKTTPFGDNTFFCIGVLEGKRNIEGKLTESEEVNLKYLKQRWAIMEDLENNQGMDRVESTEKLGFALSNDEIWEKYKRGEKIDGYTSKKNM